MYEACGMDPPADAGAGTGQTVILTRPRPYTHTPRIRSDRPVVRPPRTQEPPADAQEPALMRRMDK